MKRDFTFKAAPGFKSTSSFNPVKYAYNAYYYPVSYNTEYVPVYSLKQYVGEKPWWGEKTEYLYFPYNEQITTKYKVQYYVRYAVTTGPTLDYYTFYNYAAHYGGGGFYYYYSIVPGSYDAYYIKKETTINPTGYNYYHTYWYESKSYYYDYMYYIDHYYTYYTTNYGVYYTKYIA